MKSLTRNSLPWSRKFWNITHAYYITYVYMHKGISAYVESTFKYFCKFKVFPSGWKWSTLRKWRWRSSRPKHLSMTPFEFPVRQTPILPIWYSDGSGTTKSLLEITEPFSSCTTCQGSWMTPSSNVRCKILWENQKSRRRLKYFVSSPCFVVHFITFEHLNMWISVQKGLNLFC